MKISENLKQLKMALTSHDELIIDLGDGYFEEIYFDDEIGSYRGKEIGIWSIDLLMEIAKGEVKDTSLKLKEK